MHHAFLYLSFPSWHDYNVNLPNFTFCGGRDNKTTTSFLFSYLRYSFLDFYSKKICQHLRNLTSWNERDKVWDIDCEQSLFFFRFSESNARAISHARGHLRVSRFDRRTTEKRETARSLFEIACVAGVERGRVFETGRIRFLSDVFAAYAFGVA